MSNELEQDKFVIDRTRPMLANPEDDPATDFYPGTIMGVQACLGTFWWILSWFMYIKHETTFNLTVENKASFTLAWAFENLSSTQYGWAAASVFVTFWIHLITSLVEFIAWIYWLYDDGGLLGWWASTIGWWGSVLIMPIPVLFAIFQVAFPVALGGFNGAFEQEIGEFSMWLIFVAGLVWLFSGLTHVIYSPRLLAQVNP